MARVTKRRKYRKKANHYVIAVRLDVDTDGFSYRKWGGKQRAKRGDWLVDQQGEIHTVDASVFARTYKRIRPGIYIKTTPVWAEVATESGSVKTKEGESRYRRGDYLIYNDSTGRDGYCMSAAKFKAMYKLAR
jgi:hypothetical protein